MNIAFCNNRLGLKGLHVALASLIQNCSDSSKLALWFLCAGHSEKDKRNIAKLLNQEGFGGKFSFIDFDPYATFGSFRSLHGDWTCYGRLLLVDLIPEDQVLYLDSDLVVEEDVLKVEQFNFDGHCLAAVGGGRFKFTYGNKFYADRVGLDGNLEYFNSGVLLLNLREWRIKNIKEDCMKIGRQHALELPSVDQSILNILCSGHFAKLPKSFNCEWSPISQRPEASTKMILHFIGSPKPWDPFAFLIHSGYQTWSKYDRKNWITRLSGVTTADLVRAWNIRRSYVRSFKDKLVQ
ncbi:glycosyltransferase family 8 protein [Pedobacter sp. SAFR-022]|uniref:glycosyltransferase family 8 protein n=1 Tax=Pedobacter sp. SAFR-022 TaxID=3436861 RepID=UPI003F81E4F2